MRPSPAGVCGCSASLGSGDTNGHFEANRNCDFVCSIVRVCLRVYVGMLAVGGRRLGGVLVGEMLGRCVGGRVGE